MFEFIKAGLLNLLTWCVVVLGTYGILVSKFPSVSILENLPYLGYLFKNEGLFFLIFLLLIFILLRGNFLYSVLKRFIPVK